MAAGIAEQVSEAKGPPLVARVQRASRKPAGTEALAADSVRFFLAKTEGSGNTPTFDRELATEAEALLESLKSGRSYYSVTEWRAIADCTGKAPQVKGEPVRNPRKGGI
jgi:hypothetical protein